MLRHFFCFAFFKTQNHCNFEKDLTWLQVECLTYAYFETQKAASSIEIQLLHAREVYCVPFWKC